MKVLKDVYGVLSRGQRGYTGDSVGRHSIEDIEEVQRVIWDHILAGRIQAAERFQTLEDCRKNAAFTFKERLTYARDGIYNPINNIGTLNDPAMYTNATVPVSISPFEATALYSSGGLPTIIIDKKSKGVLVNGITFKTYDAEFWTDERIDKLLKEVDRTGFDEKIIETLRDATLYGGAVIYPVFAKDGLGSFQRDVDGLLKRGVLERGSISRWVSVDRWNIVYVCSYDPSAADYLDPRSFYVPVSGIEVNASRCAVLRLKRLPYWGTIRQMGWGVSDLEGYIRSIYAYYVMVMSMPIMAQQMSLLLYQMPLDALNAMVGVDAVKELMTLNEEKMREWSILNPKAVNLVGEVKTIDRTFSGFEHFFDAGITDLCARAELPRPLLFHTPNKGFSDNTTESLLKESEMMKMRQKDVEPLLVNCTRMLVVHTFGTASEEYQHIDDLYMSFDKPVVATDKDKAEIGARYSATVNSLKQAGVPTRDALTLAKQFFPSIRLSMDILENSEAAYEREVQNMASGAGNGGAVRPESGIDMRGKPALNGKPAQVRSDGSTTSTAKDESGLERLVGLLRRGLTAALEAVE